MTKASNQVKSDVLVVRKINKEIYKRFRQKALEENKNVGEALNQAMDYWLSKEKESGRPDIRNLSKLNGIIKTDRPVEWSKETDELLYGGSS